MTTFQITTFTGTIQNQSTQLINARDLHQKLEIQTSFHKWIQRRISDYNFAENLDFIETVKFDRVERGFFGEREIELKDYHITLDMAKELCMLERSELGQQARRYFIAMEKQAKQQLALMPAFMQQPATPLIPENQTLIDKGRYIELLEAENTQLKLNRGKTLHPHRGQRLSDHEKAQIKQLYAQGMPKAAIARQLNRSETAVFCALKA